MKLYLKPCALTNDGKHYPYNQRVTVRGETFDLVVCFICELPLKKKKVLRERNVLQRQESVGRRTNGAS